MDKIDNLLEQHLQWLEKRVDIEPHEREYVAFIMHEYAKSYADRRDGD